MQESGLARIESPLPKEGTNPEPVAVEERHPLGPLDERVPLRGKRGSVPLQQDLQQWSLVPGSPVQQRWL